MLIVLEGADGVGKSTLAARLAEALDAKVLHKGPIERHPLEEYVRDLDWYAPGEAHVVADRWHLGELVYGPLYRGVSRLDDVQRRYVELFLRSRGALLVHVDAPLQVVRERFDARGDDYAKAEHLDHLILWYRQHVPEALCVTQRLDTNDDVPDAKLDALVDQARLLEARALVAPTARILGQPYRPAVLLVGDETSPRHLRGDRPSYAAPFVPYRDSSGYHLLANLTSDFLRRCAIVNSAEVDLLEVHAALGEPVVVALGRAAEERLTLAGLAPGVDFGVVPHPQYVRRFHHGRLSAYGHLIADVAANPRNATKEL